MSASLSLPLIITIDGPAGAGKSTLARQLAKALDMAYLDTGAMYRAMGLALGPQAADLTDDDLRRCCARNHFTLLCEDDTSGKKYTLCCNGVAIGDEIRTERAGRLASLAATLPPVRNALQEMQRAIGILYPLVAEGRDMGTCVFPHAPRKFFLDAQPEVRAERRFQELLAKGETPDKAVVLADILARDKQDRARIVDPLRPALDAVLIDTSDRSLDSVLAELVALSALKPAFSHLTANGSMRMVDVGTKNETDRVARARAVVEMSADTLNMLKRNALPKGDVLTVAKLAGIMAAKRACDFIPLCHPLLITHTDVVFTLRDVPPALILETEVRARGRTGVEMEAIVAAQVAAATVYDMAKAVQKDMVIRDVRLLYKAGGKSGEFWAKEEA